MQDYFQTVWSLNHGIDIHEVRSLSLLIAFDANKVFCALDSQGVSRGTSWGRQHASTPRDPPAADLRGSIAGMPQAAVATYQNQLLRPGRVSDTQRRRARLHLLHLQRKHGGHAEQHGGGDSR